MMCQNLMLCCVTILLWLSVATEQTGSCIKDQLEATIVSVTDYELTVDITNKGSTGVCVLKWNSMMDNKFWPVAVTLFKGNDLQNYAKPVIPLRQTITNCDYQFIDKSDFITIKRDLSQEFSFIDNMEYYLQVETWSHDCFKASKSSDCIARAADQMKALEYSKTDLATKDYTFTADADKAAVTESFCEWLTNNPPTRKTNDNSFVAFGTQPYLTEEKFNKVLKAHKEASRYLELANKYLKPYDKTHIPLYKKWFGKYSKARYEIVSNNFEETFDGTKKPYVYNYLPSDLCPPDFLAHVDTGLSGKKQHVINICPLLFNKSSSEQILTIVHEMTHDSSATLDEKLNNGNTCYSPNQCKELIKQKPMNVIYNAENYALFASAVANQQTSRKRKITKNKTTGNPKGTKRRRGKKPMFKLIQLLMLLTTE